MYTAYKKAGHITTYNNKNDPILTLLSVHPLNPVSVLLNIIHLTKTTSTITIKRDKCKRDKCNN